MSCGISIPPMMSGLSRSKACTSKPCAILNMMIHHSFYDCFRHDQILHGRDFYIVIIRCDDMDVLAQRFHHTCIIRHTQIILFRFTVGPHDEVVAKCLWSMCHEKLVPGNGFFDFTIFNPLDRVLNVHTADHSALMLDVLIKFKQYILRDKRPCSVMYEEIVGCSDRIMRSVVVVCALVIAFALPCHFVA